MMVKGAFEPHFPLEYCEKDLRLANEAGAWCSGVSSSYHHHSVYYHASPAAHAAGLQVPVAEAAQQLYLRATPDFGQQDMAAIVQQSRRETSK